MNILKRIFRRRKKPEPMWELQTVYDEAVQKLREMEAEGDRAAKEREDGYIAYIEFQQNRLKAEKARKCDSKDDLEKKLFEQQKRETIADIEAAIQLAQCKLQVELKRDNLDDLRKHVKELEAERFNWWKENRVKPLDKNTKTAAFVTIGAAAAPYVIERFGKIAPHMKGKIPTPKIWK